MKRIQVTMTLEVAESDPGAVWHAISEALGDDVGFGVLNDRGWKIIEGSAREVQNDFDPTRAVISEEIDGYLEGLKAKGNR